MLKLSALHTLSVWFFFYYKKSQLLLFGGAGFLHFSGSGQNRGLDDGTAGDTLGRSFFGSSDSLHGSPIDRKHRPLGQREGTLS